MRDLIRALRFCCRTVILLVFVSLNGTFAQTDSAPDIRFLMEQLNDDRTVQRDTVEQILELARKDPRARAYVVQKLPDLIRRPQSDVWLDAIRVAGKLKAREAIPALLEAMSRPQMPAEANLTFAGIERLDNDIVAKTLCQIGDPAIPSTVDLLKSADGRTRARAILILRNIGTTAARKALQNRLRHETDPEVKKLIRDSLRS
jgi:HEAT repeat protein